MSGCITRLEKNSVDDIVNIEGCEYNEDICHS